MQIQNKYQGFRQCRFRDPGLVHLGLPSVRRIRQLGRCIRLQPVWAVASEQATKDPPTSSGENLQLVSDSASRHASSKADFKLSASQIQGLVQEAFGRGGRFSQDATYLAERLCTSTQNGLEDIPPDAALRIQLFGANRLIEEPPVSIWGLIWEALQDRTLALLIGAGAVSFTLAATMPDAESSDWIEGAAILASVAIVVGVSSVTNFQKESKFRVLNAIKDDIQVRVVRGGEERPISTQELLVGDLLVVETGDILPADGILVAGEELRLDESHMTGEAEEMIKSVHNGSVLMLAGSKVREGYGRMIVLAVGERSQQGMLQAMVLLGAGKAQKSGDGEEATARPTPLATADREDTLLTRKLQGLADVIGNFGLAAAAFVTTVSAATYTAAHLFGPAPEPFMGAIHAYLGFFITGVTILVVAVPEGLPLAVTIALAFSVQRMLKDNNLVRHLDACETMASATTICSDKTGTLTANEMVVTRAWAGGQMYNVAPAGVPTDTRAVQAKAPAPAPLSSGDLGGLAAVGSPSALAIMGNGTAEVEVVGESCGCGPPQLPKSLPPRLLTLLREGVTRNCTASLRTDSDTGEVEKIGNRTECALLEWASQTGTPEDDGSILVQSLPFTSERKRMSVLMVTPEAASRLRPHTSVPCRLLTKGAAEVVMSRCVSQLSAEGQVIPLTEAAKEQMLEPFTRQGLRVLALAQRDLSLPSHVLSWPQGAAGGPPTPAAGIQMPVEILEEQLVLVGLLGLQDPLRSDVPLAIQQCQRAGIVVRMLTGDNARTAACIASECGILPCATDIDDSLRASANLVNDILKRRREFRKQKAGQAGNASSNDSADNATEQHADSKRAAAVANGNGNGNGHVGGVSVRSKAQPRPLASDWDMGASSSSEVSGSSSTVQGRRKPRPTNSLDEDNSNEDYYTAAASRSFDNGDVWETRNKQEQRKSAESAQKPTDSAAGLQSPNGQRAWSPETLQAANTALQQQAAAPAAKPSVPASAATPASAAAAASQDAPASQAGTPPVDPYASSVQAALASFRNQPVPSQSVSGSQVYAGSQDGSQAQGILTRSMDPGTLSIDLMDPSEFAAAMLSDNPDQPAIVTKQAVELATLAAAIETAETTSMLVSVLSSGSSSGDESPAFMSREGATSSMRGGESSVASVRSQDEKSGTQGSSAMASALAESGLDWTSASTASGDMYNGFDVALYNGPPLVLEGPQFRELVQLEDGTLDLRALKIIWPRLRVIARCSPADKYLLVTGLKLLRQTTGPDEAHLNEVVAMTGDGTNDAPALSAADVGFAMNSGTSIAKDAADILLMDNSFSSIVSAVKWGRNVYASVTKFLQFQLTANVVAVVTAGSGALLTAHSPLSAVQMLWVNLMMDSLASLALATEAPTDELLDMEPIPADQPLITPVVAKHILGQAAVQLTILASLVLHGEEWFGVNIAINDTIIFNAFVCMQLFNQFNCRKVVDEPDITSGLKKHPTFLAVVGAEAALQVVIVQFGGAAFQTRPLSPSQWALCVGLGATTLLVRAALTRLPLERVATMLPKWKA